MSRSIGEQWHPFPARLAAALGLLRWSPANPATEGVVYAYVWHLCHTGAQPKIREIATYAGRGKTWVGRVLKRVHADRALWLQKRPAEKTGQPRDSRGTADPQQSSDMEEDRDSRGTAAGHARDPIYTITDTEREKRRPSQRSSVDADGELPPLPRGRSSVTLATSPAAGVSLSGSSQLPINVVLACWREAGGRCRSELEMRHAAAWARHNDDLVGDPERMTALMRACLTDPQRPSGHKNLTTWCVWNLAGDYLDAIGGGSAEAEEMWTRVQRMRRQSGRQYIPGHDGPAHRDPQRSARCVDAIRAAFGSWSRFCGHRDDERTLQRDRGAFISAYNATTAAPEMGVAK